MNTTERQIAQFSNPYCNISNTMLIKELEYAYENSYDTYVGYATFFISNQEAAEEIVQDIFIETIVRCKNNQFFTIDNINAFIKSAIVNKAKNQHRRNFLRVVKEGKVINETTTSHFDQLNENEDAVLEAITTLPALQKQCILLRFWEDKTTIQIAAELKISKSTVKTHLKRACKSIEAKISMLDEG